MDEKEVDSDKREPAGNTSERPGSSSTNNKTLDFEGRPELQYETDIEKGTNTAYEKPDSLSANETPLDFEGRPEPQYETIRPAASHGQRSSRSRSLSRVRSYNGYGCDELADDPSDGDQANRADKDPFEVSFEDGDNDPWCPRSMAPFRKWLIVSITSFGSFCVTCGSSIYTSTYTQMDAEFGNSRIVATIGLSLFVFGIAMGPAWSPLSEFYGRRPIYLVSFLVFVLWNFGTAFAHNIGTVIVSRFFQGLSGSAFLSVAGGTVGDLFSPRQMQYPMIIFTMSPFLGPSVGPLMGGFIVTYTSWRWVHYVMIIWAFALFGIIFVLVPETYHPAVLKKKASRMRKDTGDDRLKAPIEKSQKSLVKTVGYSLVRPFEILIFEPMALILNTYSAILLGILYLFFGAIPLVFKNVHGFNAWQTGLTFLGMFTGMLIGALTGPVWTRIRENLIAKNGRITGIEGKSEPEYRLPSVMAGSIVVVVGLFWFAWTTYSWVHWILPVIGTAIFGLGTLLVFNGIFTYLVETYPLYAASALSSNALLRCSFAAAFPLFGIQMYEKLGYQWATSLLAFLTVAMLPFPYIFFRQGKKIRSKSRMARAD